MISYSPGLTGGWWDKWDREERFAGLLRQQPELWDSKYSTPKLLIPSIRLCRARRSQGRIQEETGPARTLDRASSSSGRLQSAD